MGLGQSPKRYSRIVQSSLGAQSKARLARLFLLGDDLRRVLAPSPHLSGGFSEVGSMASGAAPYAVQRASHGSQSGSGAASSYAGGGQAGGAAAPVTAGDTGSFYASGSRQTGDAGLHYAGGSQQAGGAAGSHYAGGAAGPHYAGGGQVGSAASPLYAQEDDVDVQDDDDQPINLTFDASPSERHSRSPSEQQSHRSRNSIEGHSRADGYGYGSENSSAEVDERSRAGRSRGSTSGGSSRGLRYRGGSARQSVTYSEMEEYEPSSAPRRRASVAAPKADHGRDRARVGRDGERVSAVRATSHAQHARRRSQGVSREPVRSNAYSPREPVRSSARSPRRAPAARVPSARYEREGDIGGYYQEDEIDFEEEPAYAPQRRAHNRGRSSSRGDSRGRAEYSPGRPISRGRAGSRPRQPLRERLDGGNTYYARAVLPPHANSRLGSAPTHSTRPWYGLTHSGRRSVSPRRAVELSDEALRWVDEHSCEKCIQRGVDMVPTFLAR
ncbi:hypothetical protein T492DRAFT_1148706 [Pavlovales sp. CCMP2436]|nr:hypothetical protein T492DRAFT_1148706 [Pavlovales sp. CCMP2436]